eukprot:176788-Chlamydomonas_euryale.AAC.6
MHTCNVVLTRTPLASPRATVTVPWSRFNSPLCAKARVCVQASLKHFMWASLMPCPPPPVPLCQATVSYKPHQAVGGVPNVLGGVADESPFRRPSRGGRATGRAFGDGRVTGRATRALDRWPRGPATLWRPVQDEELRPSRRRPSPGLGREPSMQPSFLAPSIESIPIEPCLAPCPGIFSHSRFSSAPSHGIASSYALPSPSCSSPWFGRPALAAAPSRLMELSAHRHQSWQPSISGVGRTRRRERCEDRPAT